MHIEIKQSKDVSKIEQVSSDLIEKLYQLAYEDDLVQSQLDSTSVLEGRLSTNVAYQRSCEYLMEKFPNLIIVAATYYYAFKDPEWTRFCVDHWGGGEAGITLQQLYAVNQFTDQHKTDITQYNIETLDFTPFFNVQNIEKFSNVRMPTLKTFYVKNYKHSMSFPIMKGGVEDPVTGQYHIDKIIIDGIGLGQQQIYGQYRLLNSDSIGNQHVGTLAIRRICPNATNINNDTIYCYIGDYAFRSVKYDNFYLGEPDPERVKCKTGWGDNVNGNCINFYVPVGCAEAYANSSTWGIYRSSFLEYDFENDPEHLFDF